VATIHDLGITFFPEFSTPRFREMQVGLCKRLAATCHKIITDSDSTRRDFLGRYDFPPEDVVTIPLGVESAYRPQNPEELQPILSRYGLAKEYLLYVGEISRRKNIKNLLAAYAKSSHGRDLPLVIVGSQSFGAKEILSEIPSLGLEDRVLLLGYVPDPDLPAIYAGASAFLFPTYYEGFGLPVLEAMASGVPTVTSNCGAVPEITGDHAVLVEPDDVESIAAGISRALEMTDADRTAARNHVAKFTWDECARRTRAVYHDAWENFHGK
jgi:glycosyltransferase involved in cell wall biosynthesis